MKTNLIVVYFINFFFLIVLKDDLKLWLPDAENPPTDLDLETSRFLLKQVGDHFCDLLVQEKDAFDEHMSDGKCFISHFKNFVRIICVFFFFRR